MGRAFFLTGRPGIGKTTVLLRIVKILKEKGLKVGGIISREIRRDNSRIGFKLIDLESGREGWLAHVKQPNGPRVGKYRVCMKDLESIGVKAILKAVKEADIVVIDEVGPMEMFSECFKKAVAEALNSEKIVLGTVHYRIKDSFTAIIKAKGDIEVVEVTIKNREILPENIARKVSEDLREHVRVARKDMSGL